MVGCCENVLPCPQLWQQDSATSNRLCSLVPRDCCLNGRLCTMPRFCEEGGGGTQSFPLGRETAGVFVGAWRPALDRGPRLVPRLSGLRSEERRVGKECRFRWSP